MNRALTTLRIPARMRLTRMKFRKTRVAASMRRAGRKASLLNLKFRGRLTLMADRLETKLPSRLVKPFGLLRSFSPLSVGSYLVHKFKKDPIFLTGYGAVSVGFWNLQAPLMIGMGVNPALALTIRAASIPLDLFVVTLREHRNRTDRSRTYRGTLRYLATEYKDYVHTRRRENRQFMNKDRTGRTALGEMARGLRTEP